jgi:hypothetical protein
MPKNLEEFTNALLLKTTALRIVPRVRNIDNFT